MLVDRRILVTVQHKQGVDKMTKQLDKQFKRLAMLSFYISKYSNLWGNSPRLFGWVDEYNTLRANMPWEQWKQYCDKMGYADSHDGYDNLA
jgi:hypothetical protein